MFELLATDGAARRGRLTTPHGTVETPVFMPCGTYGSVKGMTPASLRDVGTQILLGNTFHLLLRPGDAEVAALGGLHKFMAWDGPILTDSGGFQVFSLRELRKVSEEGVEFRSPINGDRILLTPERSIGAQRNLGSDVVMSFDECTPYPATEDEARASMELSMRWAERGRKAHAESPNLLFGIVQGGMHANLRRESLDRLTEMGFDGYAIGGLSVGESKAEMNAVLAGIAPHMPEAAPRYLMGVGMPDDLVEAVARGVDLFDCVLPTRNARNGQLFTRRGPLSIKGAVHAEDDRPPDPDCGCYTCRHFSRAYLRHLYVAREMTAATLNTLHNLHFYLDTMRRMREAIGSGSFDVFRQAFHRTYSRRPRHELPDD